MTEAAEQLVKPVGLVLRCAAAIGRASARMTMANSKRKRAGTLAAVAGALALSAAARWPSSGRARPT